MENEKVGHMEVDDIEECHSSRDSVKKSELGSHYDYKDEEKVSYSQEQKGKKGMS